MDEEEMIRARVAQSADELATEFAFVMMPKGLLPGYTKAVNAIGMDLRMVDDGEDDGVPGFHVVPSSKAMDAHLSKLTLAFRWVFGSFLAAAVMVVVVQAVGEVPEALPFLWFILTLYAWQALRVHGRRSRLRRLQAHIAEHGH